MFEDAADTVLDLLGVPKLNLGRSDRKEQSTSEAEQHSDENPLEIVSIHGMLGLGKTPFARKHLNDPQVEYHFFVRIFVSVSKNYNKKEVFLSVLSAFIKDIRDHNMPVKKFSCQGPRDTKVQVFDCHGRCLGHKSMGRSQGCFSRL